MQHLAQVYGITLGVPNKEFDPTIKDVVTSIWSMVYKVYKQYLHSVKDEIVLQSILNSMQFWISVCGSIGGSKMRDAFIKLLAQSCVRKDEVGQQESKTLFNVAHCLGKVLEVTSWHQIFLAMEQMSKGGDEEFVGSVVKDLFGQKYERE